MARPTTRKGTANIQYQKRIPADVLRILNKLPPAYRLPGWGKTQITISTGTADRRRGQAEYARIASEVEERFAILRVGIRTLSLKEAVGLSSTVYKAFAENLENNPGSPDRWSKVLADNASASAGRFGLGALLIGKTAQREASMEARFGPLVDNTLAKEGLVICPASRVLVLQQFAVALDQAAKKLKQNASGDFRPDPNADRFPVWEGAQPKQSRKKLTLSELFDRWAEHPEQSNKSQRTLNRYKGVFGEVQQFLKNPDVHAIKTDDIRRYADAMMAEGELAPRTVRDVHKAALSSVFNWAIGKGIMQFNPAEAVKIKVQKAEQLRPKELTAEEAKALAEACLSIDTIVEPWSAGAARRWCPLICMYSGARIGEVTQLRKQDIVQRGDHWFIRITPEAGTVKDREYREVPIHVRLIEIGLLEYVNRCEGTLFIDPALLKGKKTLTPISELVARQVAKWAKANALPDPLLTKPLHAIRHRFITLARRAGIAEEYTQAITGHSSGEQNRKYGSYELAVLARELGKLTVKAVEGQD